MPILALFSLLFLFMTSAPGLAQGQPFVLQCAPDETITRVVVRTGRRLDFIGIDCTDPAGQRRILRTGGDGGTRHEFLAPQGIASISTSRGRCNAPTRRVCSIAFTFGGGGRSGALGTLTDDRQRLGGNGEIYGLWGRSGSEIDDLRVLTRKTEALADPNYDIAGAMRDIDALMSNAMGYAAAIRAPDGRRIGLARAGWAIHPLDTELGDKAGIFDVHTKAVAGSTTKIWATAAAALRVDERTEADTLDTAFSTYLPARWRDDVHARFAGVTVRDVIRHRAGFRKGRPGVHVTTRIANGDQPGQGCSRDPAPPYATCYSNSAGGLFHFILSQMDLASETGAPAVEANLTNASDADYNEAIQRFTGGYYRRYVEQNILAPVNAIASCDPHALMPDHQVAAAYPSPAGRTGWIESDVSDNCASGGWIISVDDLTRVLWALRNTDLILNAQSRAELFDTGPDGLWQFRRNGAFVHNGGRGNAAAGIVVMPDGYVAAIAYNSEGSVRMQGADRALADILANRRR